MTERRLLGAIALVRHEGVEVGTRRLTNLPSAKKPKGISSKAWHEPSSNPDHQTGLSEDGIKGAGELGKRMADSLLEDKERAAAIKKSGLAYFGVFSPMTRAVETGQLNFTSLKESLEKQGVKVKKATGRTHPGLAIMEHGDRIYYHPPEPGDAHKAKEDADVAELARYAEAQGVKGTEPLRKLRQRMQVVTDLEQRLRRWKPKTPLMIHLTTHGGIGGVPIQMDDAAVWLTNRNVKGFGGPLMRGEGLVKYIYSDGTSEVHVMRKDPAKDITFNLRNPR